MTTTTTTSSLLIAATADEQLRCFTWQIKKGGILTFLSAQTIDDSDRGTCWHMGQGEAGKAEEPEWLQIHKLCHKFHLVERPRTFWLPRQSSWGGMMADRLTETFCISMGCNVRLDTD
jgi:hypothetical protein